MPAKRVNELPGVLTGMADAALKAETATVRRMTQVGTDIVDQHGRKFHIRAGSTGKRWPLEGKGDVQTFGTRDGQPVVRGAIRGVPEGFWVIVTEGSRKHVISTRRQRGAEVRYSSGGAIRRSISVRQQNRMIGNRANTNRLAPIRTPYGPRQWVMHPGHGPIGQPWNLAMLQASQRLPQVAEYETSRRLVQAFTGK